MNHLIVGDGHYIGQQDSAEAWRQLLAKAQQHGVTEVSILGDFMELWLGLAGLEQPWHESLLAPLWQLKRHGVRLRYVVGNKDFFIDAWNTRHELFDAVHAVSCVVPSPIGPLHLAHGDLVNKADRQYRLWRAFSRSLPVSWLVRSLPRQWLARRAESVAEAMKSTNTHHKSYFPEAQLRARARELQCPPMIMIYGHFHVHNDFQEGQTRIITLPFLGGENAGIWVSEQGVQTFAL